MKKFLKVVLFVVLAISLVCAVLWVVGGVAYEKMFKQQEAVTK